MYYCLTIVEQDWYNLVQYKLLRSDLDQLGARLVNTSNHWYGSWGGPYSIRIEITNISIADLLVLRLQHGIINSYTINPVPVIPEYGAY